MDQVKLEKVTVNMSFGGRQERQNAAMTVLQSLTNRKPLLVRAKNTVREFGVHKGEPMAVITTLRGKAAEEFLSRALVAVNGRIKDSSYDGRTTYNFGIAEHITIPGTKYIPELGIFGMNIAITLYKPGKRITLRKEGASSLPAKKFVSKEEAQEFMKKRFGVSFE